VDEDYDYEQEPGEDNGQGQGPWFQQGTQPRRQRVEVGLSGGALTATEETAALEQSDGGADAEQLQKDGNEVA